MNKKSKFMLIVTLTVVVAVFLPFGSGAMNGTMMSGGMIGGGIMGGGMMSEGAMSAVSWMWIPTLLIVAVGAALCWVIFARKK